MSAQASGKPGSLFAALAALQASLPKIVKGETGKIQGKDGKQGYSYKYADLADVSQEILPRMGKLGLAFTSKPTIIDGQFVLSYSLIHESGDREDGMYPLPSSASPQQIGSAITYARRYCLCAVTGVAPDSDDDDGAAAEHSYRQSAGDVFEGAAPARPRNGRQQGQVSRPAATAPPANEPPAADSAEIDEAAQELAVEAFGCRSVSELRRIYEGARGKGKLGAFIADPASGVKGPLGNYLNHRRKVLEDTDAALRELNDAAGRHGTSITELERRMGTDLESATPVQIREFIASLDGAAA